MDRRQLFGAVFGAACAFLFVGRASAQGAGRDAELIRAAEAATPRRSSACSRRGGRPCSRCPGADRARCGDLRQPRRRRAGADRGGRRRQRPGRDPQQRIPARRRARLSRNRAAHARRGGDLKSTNRYGGTALIPACHYGHVETVRELLKTTIDVDHVNNLGWTALLEAVILGDGGPAHTEIVRLLVAAGARVNLADRQGVTGSPTGASGSWGTSSRWPTSRSRRGPRCSRSSTSRTLMSASRGSAHSWRGCGRGRAGRSRRSCRSRARGRAGSRLEPRLPRSARARRRRIERQQSLKGIDHLVAVVAREPLRDGTGHRDVVARFERGTLARRSGSSLVSPPAVRDQVGIRRGRLAGIPPAATIRAYALRTAP